MWESGARLPRRAPDACGVAAGRTRSAASGWKRPFPTMHGSQHLTAPELCHEHFVILIPACTSAHSGPHWRSLTLDLEAREDRTAGLMIVTPPFRLGVRAA
jgi:hypothetical protein